jgi:acyl-CoA reductase-like NAD-dependent aldehyde dehydrogenase
MKHVPPPPPRRPSARAPLQAVHPSRLWPGQRYELDILHAKARVCDAYRRWLETTSHKERAEVCEALAELARKEEGYHA